MPQDGARVRHVESRETVAQIEVAGDPNTLNGGSGVNASPGTMAINPASGFMYYNADGNPTGWQEFGTVAGIPTGETNIGANVGNTGGESYRDKTGATLNFRRVKGTPPIVGATDGDHIDMSFDILLLGTDDTPAPEDELLLRQNITGNYVRSTLADVIGEAGEVNVGVNLGLGAGVYASKSATALQFRSLVATPNEPIHYSSSGTEITIGMDFGLVPATGVVDPGDSVLIQKTGTGELEIATAADFDVTTAINVGTGAGVFYLQSGAELQFRSLLVTTGHPLVFSESGVDIDITVDLDIPADITPPIADTDITLIQRGVDAPSKVDIGTLLATSNIGTGAGVFAGRSAGVDEFYSLAEAPGNPLVMNTLADDIEVKFDMSGLTLNTFVTDDDEFVVRRNDDSYVRVAFDTLTSEFSIDAENLNSGVSGFGSYIAEVYFDGVGSHGTMDIDFGQNLTRFRFRFYIDTQYAIVPLNTSIDICRITDAPNNKFSMLLHVRYSAAGQWEFLAQPYHDGDSGVNSDYFPLNDGGNMIEVDWNQATAPGANDGFVNIWVNSVNVGNVSGIDNDNRTVSSMDFGSNTDLTTMSGALHFDAFEVRDTTYIGSVGETVPLGGELIFEDGFESGDFSAWDSADTRLRIVASKESAGWYAGKSGNTLQFKSIESIGSDPLRLFPSANAIAVSFDMTLLDFNEFITDDDEVLLRRADNSYVRALFSTVLDGIGLDGENLRTGVAGFGAYVSEFRPDGSAEYNTWSPGGYATGDYRQRFYFNTEFLTLSGSINICQILHGTSQKFNFNLAYDAVLGYSMSVSVRDENNSSLGSLATGYFENGGHYVEVWWERASADDIADGSVTLWFDGVQTDQFINVKTFTADFQTIRVGDRYGAAGATGVIHFDEFEVRDETYIGFVGETTPNVGEVRFYDGWETGDQSAWNSSTPQMVAVSSNEYLGIYVGKDGNTLQFKSLAGKGSDPIRFVPGETVAAILFDIDRLSEWYSVSDDDYYVIQRADDSFSKISGLTLKSEIGADGKNLKTTSGSFGQYVSKFDASQGTYQKTTFSDQTRIRLRCYFNTEHMTPADGATSEFIQILGNTRKAVKMWIKYTNQNKWTISGSVDRGDNVRYSIVEIPFETGAHYIEIDWKVETAPSANDGYWTVWFDGVEQETISGLFNDDRVVETFRFGSFSGNDTIWSGHFYFDEVEVRSATYIGAYGETVEAGDLVFYTGFEPGDAWTGNPGGWTVVEGEVVTELYAGNDDTTLLFRTLRTVGSNPQTLIQSANHVDITFDMLHLTTNAFLTNDDEYIIHRADDTYVRVQHQTVRDDILASVPEPPVGGLLGAANVGSGATVYRDELAGVLNFKSFLAESNTPLTWANGANELTIEFDLQNIGSTLTVSSTDEILVQKGDNVHYRVAIADLPSSGVVGGANLGAGEPVFEDLFGGSLRFNSLDATAPIIVASAANEITYDFDINLLAQELSPNGADFLILRSDGDGLNYKVNIDDLPFSDITGGANVGTGIGVYDAVVGTNLTFLSLEAAAPLKATDTGTTVAFEFDIDLLTVSGSPTSGDYLVVRKSDTNHYKMDVDQFLIGESNSGTNIGSGAGQVFAAKVGETLQFHTLTAGVAMDISTGGSTITIDWLPSSLSVSANPPLPSETTFIIYDADAGVNDWVTVSGTLIDWYTASNVGGANNVFKQKTDFDFEFRTLVAGSSIGGINVSTPGDSIQFDLNVGSLQTATPVKTDFLSFDDSGTTRKAQIQTILELGGHFDTLLNVGTGSPLITVNGNELTQKTFLSENGLSLNAIGNELKYGMNILGLTDETSPHEYLYAVMENAQLQGTFTKVSYLKLRKNYGLKWNRTTDFSLAHNTSVPMTWENEDRDSIGQSPGQNIFISQAGVYQINVMVGMKGLATESIAMQLILYANGSNEVSRIRLPAIQSTSISRLPLSVASYFGNGDYITLHVNQTNGASASVDVTEGYITVDLIGVL